MAKQIFFFINFNYTLILRYRKLKFADESTRSSVYDEFREMIDRIELQDKTIVADSDSDSDQPQPLPKKATIADEDIDSESEDETENAHPVHELDRYLKHHFTCRCFWNNNLTKNLTFFLLSHLGSELGVHRLVEFVAENFDVAHFWRKQSETFPRISKLASWLLAILASSTSVERTFSVTGAKLDARRTNLSPGTLGSLTFVHMNKRFWPLGRVGYGYRGF